MSAPSFGGYKEPSRRLRKAMARRKSPLGDLEALPEHIALACLARLPREDHDAVADCSCGLRRLMRSERFLGARRAADVFEDAIVLVSLSEPKVFVALVSDRMWRRLASPPEEHLRKTDTQVDLKKSSTIC